MDVASVESGLMFSRLLVGGLLAWAAVTIAFGPELFRSISRLRAGRAAYAATSTEAPPTRPSPSA